MCFTRAFQAAHVGWRFEQVHFTGVSNFAMRYAAFFNKYRFLFRFFVLPATFIFLSRLSFSFHLGAAAPRLDFSFFSLGSHRL